MLNPSVTLDRFLATFVPGAVVVFGSFYLHRPLLIRYFPNLAGDGVTESSFIGVETWALVFSVLALCAGVVLNQLSDIAVISSVLDESQNTRSRGLRRRLVRNLSRLFTISPLPDYRRLVAQRYLQSERAEAYLDLIRSWAHMDRDELEKAGGATIAHQHLIARLRVLSDRTRDIYRDMRAELTLAACLHLAMVLLFLSALLAPLSGRLVWREVVIHSHATYLVFILSAYGAAVATAFNLKRNIRTFFNYSTTVALHAFFSNREDNALMGKQDHVVLHRILWK